MKEGLYMEKNYCAVIELLGETNVKLLQDGIREIILDRVKEDLEQSYEYLLIPDDFQNMIAEIIEECKQEIKPMIKERLFEKALSQINI